MAEIKIGFDDLLNKISEKAQGARQIAESVIDSEVREFDKNVQSKIPETHRNIPDRGGLRASYRCERDNSKGEGYYGYRIYFEGNTKYGDSWEKIANIVNYGDIYQTGTGFLTKAEKRLRGMSQRIEARIAAEMDKVE